MISTNSNLRIIEPSEAAFIIEPSITHSQICLPETAVIDFETAAFGGFDDKISFDIVSELPEGTIFGFSANEVNPSESTQLTLSFPTGIPSQSIEIIVEATGGTLEARQRKLSFDLVSNDFSDLIPTSPKSGSEDVGVLPIFSWTSSIAADSYFLELSTSPSFAESNLLEVEIVDTTDFESTVILEKSTLYYWRVSGKNICGVAMYGPVQTFHTEVQSCKVYGDDDVDIPITTAGSPTIEYDLNIFDEGIVKDINIGKLKGLHDQISDLKTTLISPAGTEILLFEKQMWQFDKL